jgi:hypothetical protein
MHAQQAIFGLISGYQGIVEAGVLCVGQGLVENRSLLASRPPLPAPEASILSKPQVPCKLCGPFSPAAFRAGEGSGAWPPAAADLLCLKPSRLFLKNHVLRFQS